jgi:hypothetical protein
MGGQYIPPYMAEFTSKPLDIETINETCAFLGTTYLIIDSRDSAERLETLGYEEVSASGNISLYRTPFSAFPENLEVLSYSGQRIRLKALSDGRHTIKFTYLPFWEAVDGAGKKVELESDGGYISFHAGEGEEVVIERVLPGVFYAGVLVSVVSLALALAVLLSARGKRSPLTYLLPHGNL